MLNDRDERGLLSRIRARSLAEMGSPKPQRDIIAKRTEELCEALRGMTEREITHLFVKYKDDLGVLFTSEKLLRACSHKFATLMSDRDTRDVEAVRFSRTLEKYLSEEQLDAIRDCYEVREACREAFGYELHRGYARGKFIQLVQENFAEIAEGVIADIKTELASIMRSGDSKTARLLIASLSKCLEKKELNELIKSDEIKDACLKGLAVELRKKFPKLMFIRLSQEVCGDQVLSSDLAVYDACKDIVKQQKKYVPAVVSFAKKILTTGELVNFAGDLSLSDNVKAAIAKLLQYAKLPLPRKAKCFSEVYDGQRIGWSECYYNDKRSGRELLIQTKRTSPIEVEIQDITRGKKVRLVYKEQFAVSATDFVTRGLIKRSGVDAPERMEVEQFSKIELESGRMTSKKRYTDLSGDEIAIEIQRDGTKRESSVFVNGREIYSE